VPDVGARLADVHGLAADAIRAATRRNAELVFGLD
jgi:hypothetical protein